MLKRALAFVTGIAGAAAPEKLLDICARSTLVGYENPEELEPSEWYVDATRYAAVLLAIAALIAPFLPTPGGDDEAGGDAEDGPVVEVIESSDE